jgi:hypothetical protein
MLAWLPVEGEWLGLEAKTLEGDLADIRARLVELEKRSTEKS